MPPPRTHARDALDGHPVHATCGEGRVVEAAVEQVDDGGPDAELGGKPEVGFQLPPTGEGVGDDHLLPPRQGGAGPLLAVCVRLRQQARVEVVVPAAAGVEEVVRGEDNSAQEGGEGRLPRAGESPDEGWGGRGALRYRSLSIVI